MFWNQIKTVLLLGGLSALFFWFGYGIGGSKGLTIAFVMSIMMNLFAYYFSDKMVLAMYGAQPLNRETHPKIYEMVEELTAEARIPMPKLWLIPTEMCNAFATGRNPEHASVAVTEGITQLLDEDELKGVIAHELGHVKNRDILIATIAATIASAIGYLAQMMQWAFIFGSSDRNDREGNSGWGMLIVAILMPIAAMFIQMAISRSREYLADESGAKFCHDPLSLASALEKISYSSERMHTKPESTAQAATASLFIVNPFSAKGFLTLLSTHPPMEERIKRLQEMAKRM
jgi:heat shock protein HtpX